jgi:O-Antigen ligase
VPARTKGSVLRLVPHRFASRRRATSLPLGLLFVLLVMYGVGIAALFSSGRVDLRTAITLLAAPAVVAASIVRPEWILLFVVLLPPSLMGQVPPMQMVAVLVVALFGFLLQGRLHLDLRTGIYPLVGIIAFAMATRAEVPPDAAAFADGVLKNLVYYCLLMLVAFQATANETLRVDRFADALLFGIVGATIVQPFLPAIVSGIEGFSRNPYQGAFANLAVIGFGVTYIRRSLSPSLDRRRSSVDGVLMIAFLALTIISYNRAAFIAALLCFAFVSIWTAKKSFWIVAPLILALAFTIPVIGEAVVPGGSVDISNQETLTRVTSGRSVLWADLWQRGAEALPLGNGWGYTWSLTSLELFGFEGAFSASDQGFIYPHSDFLFLFVELGGVGLALLVVFWIQLARRFRFLSRFADPFVRFDVRILTPIFVTMFTLQLFANGFSVRFVAERFFIAAGLMCGMHHGVRRAQSAMQHVGRKEPRETPLEL